MLAISALQVWSKGQLSQCVTLDHGTRVPAGVTRVGAVKAGSEYRPCLIITYSHTDSDIITHILFVQDIFSICRCV